MIALWAIAAAMVQSWLHHLTTPAVSPRHCNWLSLESMSLCTSTPLQMHWFLNYMDFFMQVPLMSRNNDFARNVHISANVVNTGLFVWQVSSAAPS